MLENRKFFVMVLVLFFFLLSGLTQAHAQNQNFYHRITDDLFLDRFPLPTKISLCSIPGPADCGALLKAERSDYS